MMSAVCLQCHSLQQIALKASREYHDCLADLEAAYIRHDSEALQGLSVRAKIAFELRNSALAGLSIHENTHAERRRGDRG